MGSAVLMRADYSAAELRRLARRSKDTRQSSRLLSLAAVRDGMSRAEAARIGGSTSAPTTSDAVIRTRPDRPSASAATARRRASAVAFSERA